MGGNKDHETAPVIRMAEARDVGTILRLIRALADFENLLDAVSATEADISRDGFGPERKFECLLAKIDGEAVGFALYFVNYSTFEGRAGLYLEDLVCCRVGAWFGYRPRHYGQIGAPDGRARLRAARSICPTLEPGAGIL